MQESREREKMLRGAAEAADPEPWRCIKCGWAIRKGMKDPCACSEVLSVLDAPLPWLHLARAHWRARAKSPDAAVRTVAYCELMQFDKLGVP